MKTWNKLRHQHQQKQNTSVIDDLPEFTPPSKSHIFPSLMENRWNFNFLWDLFSHWHWDIPVMSWTWKKGDSSTTFSKVKAAWGRAGELRQSLGQQGNMNYFSLSKIKMGIDLSWVYKQRTIQDLDLCLRPCSSWPAGYTCPESEFAIQVLLVPSFWNNFWTT